MTLTLSTTLVITLLLAVLIGVSLGLLGGGGSILTVPILAYVAGMDSEPGTAPSWTSSTGRRSTRVIESASSPARTASPVSSSSGARSPMTAGPNLFCRFIRPK